jgi:retron-type reverse transcriptase
MSLLDRFVQGLRSLFGPRTVTRGVARLRPAGADDASGRAPDAATEEVRTRGPLKPNHRREVKRDPRLLPKPPRGPFTRRPKLMSADEARRRFSSTLRSASRQLSDLLPDEAQLQRYGLPVWRTEAELAAALGVSVKLLRHFSIHRPMEGAPHYIAFRIPKRRGGTRVIHAPKKRLKALQRKLHDLLVRGLPVSEHAHGFVRGRSVRTNAAPHVKKAAVVKLDLRDFFPSVTYARVRGLLIALGYGYEVAATLAVLMTEAERQPLEVNGRVFHVPVGPRVCVQGAPTSPGLCNALVLRLDRRLGGLARKHGFSYTRYADDLTFSGDEPRKAERLIPLVARIVKEEGFALNEQKTRILRRGGRQVVAGVTVNEVLGLSRQERRRIRAMLHQAQKTGDSQLRQEAEGHLAWVHMLNEEQAAKLRRG